MHRDRGGDGGSDQWKGANYYVSLKVPCSYELTAMVKFALLVYMSEFRLRFRRFDSRQLEFESLRRTGHL